MKEIAHYENMYLLRFDRGEEVLEKLQQFCTENGIHGGSFTGLGAAQAVTLADYDLEKKEYHTKEYSEVLEIASLTGNIALDAAQQSEPRPDGRENVMIHAHGVFSTLAKVYGGHVMKLVVGGACEITLSAFPEAMYRERDEETGLKLLK